MKKSLIAVVSIVLLFWAMLPVFGQGGWDRIDSEPILKQFELTLEKPHIKIGLKNIRIALEKAGINEKVTIHLMNSKKNILKLGTFAPKNSESKPSFSSIPTFHAFPGETWLPGLEWNPKGKTQQFQGTLIIKDSKNTVRYKKAASFIVAPK